MQVSRFRGSRLSFSRSTCEPAPPDIAAAYAIFRRYLFDYRVDLETPLWLLVDAESRVRKIYAAAPEALRRSRSEVAVGAVARAARTSLRRFLHRPSPARLLQVRGAAAPAGYPEQALPYLEEMLRRTPDNPKALFAVGRIHLGAKRVRKARKLGPCAGNRSSLPEALERIGRREAGPLRGTALL